MSSYAMLNTAEETTCPLVGAPDDYHFSGYCEDCDVAALRHATLDQVEYRYHTGRIGQDLFEAYMYVWVTATFRYGNWSGWEIPPTPPTVRRIARKMYRALGRTPPADLAE